MTPIRVSNIVLSSATEVELSARVDGLPSTKEGERLWFRFPLELLNKVRAGGEPFLAALLPIAMALGRPLVVEAPVSEQLLDGCRRIMSLYKSWDRRLRRVELRAQAASARNEDCLAIGSFFTGGVDSFYSLLKNLEREPRENRISHLLFIRGYANCPLDNERLFDGLCGGLEAVAQVLKLQLVVISTNLKSFIPPPAAGWDWYAGSMLAAPALCLTAIFRRVIIPSGDTYWTLSPWGSHPLVDPLWSTERLEFVHDGCEASRSQKLERYVARSRLALQNLRVCDYDQSGLNNCGTCEKCLRTLIGLRALGVEVPQSVFAQPISTHRVGQLDGGHRITRYYLRDNLELLRRHGDDLELETVLLHALRPHPLRWASRQFRFGFHELDRRFLDGRIRMWALSEAARRKEDSVVRLSPLRWALCHWLRLSRSSPEDRVRRGERQDSCLQQ